VPPKKRTHRKVIVPNRDSWATVNKRVQPVFDAALGLQAEIAYVTRPRDELLTLLMSGKVRVNVSGAAS
jgi:hypothetical protein